MCPRYDLESDPSRNGILPRPYDHLIYYPEKHSQREFCSLDLYPLEIMVAPSIVGERAVHVPDRQSVTLSELPQDVKGIVTQLGEEKIGNSNLRERLWYMLNRRAFQMKLPVIDSKGGVAILVSTALNKDESLYWEEFVGRFYYNLFKRLRYFDGVELGREPVLKMGATTEDLKEVIHDPYFSSVVTSGHGRYGVWRATDKLIDWGHVAEYAEGSSHLKSGFWIQFSCLVRKKSLASHVPFPYFAMRDPNNILGSGGGGVSNGSCYVEDYIGLSGDQFSDPKLRRISHDSFLPKLEAWKKVLNFSQEIPLVL